MQATEKEQKACEALLGTEFQLLNRPMWCEAKDPDRNVALDRREAKQTGAAKRLRGAERSGGVWGQRGLPKPLGKEAAPGGSTGAGGSTGQQGGGVSRPVITDETGQQMDRGGGEAIQEMNRLANELLVAQLGSQMKEMFHGLALKQEEENRRLKEENLAIRKQMVELEQEKLQQNNRMEQLITAMLQQMGGGQPSAGQSVSAEQTPARPSRPAVVVPTMPGTQEKQDRAGLLARQGGTGMNSTQEWMQHNSQLTPPAQHRGSSSFQQEAELAELRVKSREMEAALRDVMTEGEGAGMMTRFLEAKGHSGVVGMIALGGQLPSEAK